MSDRLTLRNDVYVHLQDFDFAKAEPEEVNRLLDRAAVEFQQATKFLRRRQPVRIVSGLGSLAPRGSVVTVTMTGGTLYTDTVTVTFTAAPSGGTTATGVPVVDGGVIRDVILTHPGEGYVVAPTITVAAGAGGGSGASGVTTIDGPAGQGFAGEILWVETSGSVRMYRTHEAKMDVLFGAAWKGATSATPTRWLHGRDGPNIVRVYPPLTAGYVYVWYAGMPAAMSNDNDQPEFDPIYHDALPWWVTARLLTVGSGPTEKISEAMGHWIGFIEQAKLAVAKMNAV